jgi:hypothetical protein
MSALARVNETSKFNAAKVPDLKAALERDEPSPMVYNSPPPAEILEEDKSVIGFKVKPTEIRIVPVDQMFQK